MHVIQNVPVYLDLGRNDWQRSVRALVGTISLNVDWNCLVYKLFNSFTLYQFQIPWWILFEQQSNLHIWMTFIKSVQSYSWQSPWAKILMISRFKNWVDSFMENTDTCLDYCQSFYIAVKQCQMSEWLCFFYSYNVGLGVTLGLIAVELIGFISGVTMFMPMQDLICILWTWVVFQYPVGKAL